MGEVPPIDDSTITVVPSKLTWNSTDQVGYYLGPTDNVSFLAELMNTAMVNQTAFVIITYEYISLSPSFFRKGVPVFIDIGGCPGYDLAAHADTTFDYTSSPWTSTVSGKITTFAGHLHDSGVNIDILRNNQSVCNDVASYGHTPEYVSPPPTAGAAANAGIGNAS